MKQLARLYRQLDASNRSSSKEAALATFFRDAPPADAAWAFWLLCGERLPQPVPVRVLKAAAMAASGIDEMLFADCYEAVGDLAETVALLLPAGGVDDGLPLHQWIVERIAPLRGMPEPEQRAGLAAAWSKVDAEDALVLNKLLTGGLRVGVSRGLTLRGLAAATGLPATALAARLTGDWKPDAANWDALVAPESDTDRGARPYPFRLAHPLDVPPEDLGRLADWVLEWKLDGIRGQLVRRDRVHLWSRGDENLDLTFPDLLSDAQRLPAGTVLDGEVLVARPDTEGGLTVAHDDLGLEADHLPAVTLAPFAELQHRIGRKAPSRMLLTSHPAVFIAFDLLELAAVDWRGRPLSERREALQRLLDAHAIAARPRLFAAPALRPAGWREAEAMRGEARRIGAEGLMLKLASSAYGSGRTRGGWWKWKLDPHSVDAVLVYAQAGHGRRAGLFTDYTFAVWHEGKLLPFAKAYSGLNDAEMRAVDRFVRRNTLESFGPVRQVRPELVFEIGFEGVLPSRRHKAGLAVRFPRMLRWRQDKSAAEAGSLAELAVLVRTPDPA